MPTLVAVGTTAGLSRVSNPITYLRLARRLPVAVRFWHD
jgi:hypothetical protein